jgi:hypothetical protein
MIDPARANSEPPVTLDELSAALDSGVLTSRARRIWQSVVAAAGHSRVSRLANTMRASVVGEESVLYCAGIVIVVAMAVHLMLLTAQPYPYPGHATYWLPTALLVAGVVLIVSRRPIAAAWRDRNERR